MRKSAKVLSSLLFVIFQMMALSSFAASPMGDWKTIDDVTGRVKSIVKISGSPSDLSGRVVKLFPGAMTTCTSCEGNLKNRPIQGMTVMYDMKQDKEDPNKWTDGSILDPKTGKVYHCTITVSEDGKTLTVRGYIGVSLFGRSQEWVKVSR